MNLSETESPFWNEQHYLILNPDVKDAIAAGSTVSGLNHYLQFGAWERRNNGAGFNETAYLARYLDVATAISKGEFGSAFQHFLLFGQHEGRAVERVENSGRIDAVTGTPSGQRTESSIAPNYNQYTRISTDLLDLAQKFANRTPTNSNSIFTGNEKLLSLNSTGTEVTVRITASNVNNLLPSLENLGFKAIASRPDLHFVEGTIPIANLLNTESLANKGLLGIIPVYRPKTNKGAVTSQADFVLEGDRVRATIPPGYDGTGVKIGVLSDSYNNLGGASADIASGDLPAAGVQVLQDAASGGSDEGRAMLQLIHDLAPGSPLAFATAYNTEGDFAQNIRDLADPAKGNAKIIVDDIIYLAEPFFQDGIVAQAVDDVVTNRGVSYFSSAGNYANQAYESTQAYAPGAVNFVTDAALDAAIGTSATYYDFDPGAGTDTRQRITLGAGQSITLSLQWDDPFYTAAGVDTDLDIYLLGTSGNVLRKANTNNILNQTPVEILDYTNSTSLNISADLVIRKRTGPTPGRFKYVNFGSATFNEYAPNGSTISSHAGAANGMAVAAVPFFNQTVPESFTSVGPTTILFNPNGTAKAAPEIRNKPDIAAIDGADTTFFGQTLSGDGTPTYKNFFGTSAAAPHAAAVAALIKQANPSFTPAQIYNRLKTTAKDIGAVGVDNVTGSGLINAYDAIFGPAVPAALNFNDGLENGVLSSSYETNTTGAGRIQVTTTNGPATGTRHLTLDSSRNNTSSRNEAILHVNTNGYTNVNLSFSQKEFNDADNPMPETFAGSGNYDGVALSVDGTNWYRLFSLTGANSTNTYQNKSINLTDFATAKGLTLGSDVQIEFQQQGSNSIASGNGGFAFDNINVTGNPFTPPVIALPSGTLNYIENDGQDKIDIGATVTDIDSANFNNGKLTVKFVSGATNDDLLLILNEQTTSNPVQMGTVGAGVDIPGSNKVTYNFGLVGGGLKTVGSFTGGSNGNPLEIIFNNLATPGVVQAVMRNISYGNNSDNPIPGNRTVEFQLTDDKSLASNIATKTINVTAVNDKPIVGLPGAEFEFYNGSGTPNSQGFFYKTVPYNAVGAIQNGGNLDTTDFTEDYAGYVAKAELMPVLDRNAGYTVNFALKVNSEDHSDPNADKNGDGKADRAGLSAIVLGKDKKGIELGFWTDRIWAQNDGVAEPPDGTLLTHGEEVLFDTTSATKTYQLKILGNTYTLSDGSTDILTGNLRDYSNYVTPSFLPDNRYNIPNFLFFGDNTSTSSANFDLGATSIVTGPTPVPLTADEDTDLIVKGVAVNEVDSADNQITATLQVNSGKLTLNQNVVGGVSAANITGNGTANLTLVGTAAQINATLADLNGLMYRGNLGFSGTDTLTFAVSDGGFSGNGDVLTDTKSVDITVNASPNEPPKIDLNGIAEGVNYSATYYRGGGSVAIVDTANLAVTDDGDTIDSAKVAIANPIDGASDILAVDNALAASLGIGVNYTAGVLSLTGSKTKAQYEQLLRTVSYNNTFFLPNSSNRVINFTVNDGKLDSDVATAIVAINSPPPINLLDITNSVVRPPIDGVGNTNPNDIFAFSLSANTRLVAELTNSGGNADLGLFNSQSVLLLNSTNTGTASERIDYATLTPGSYYLQVYRANPGETVSYRLRINAINV